ncbi:right-handed parallel beta-helix repeat-containing protein [Paenibacillus sp. LMG 31456]|uniref:Right-handed parallel beta-helix repeat-containing protein n=1 Tax=Paenibacillus foliorum TaxID=2654974 RepID=A0A972K3U0_9BACL|nr:right-handed parallel beta-helix repeat-containing protein [Paenibacillus foliorum]NOU97330.1 right-handed parallel beta-helix repeat-containing protein [Paenibacillus foliorum]
MGYIKKQTGGGVYDSLDYIIDLSRWGIKNNLTESQATTDGINNALVWAQASGFNHVFLPGGRYLINLKPGIQMVSNMYLELASDASLEMETNSAPGYSVVSFNAVQNSKITGGKILGDRQTHLFSINTGWVRGGVNPDGSLNGNRNFIRTPMLDRRTSVNACLESFRLWKPTGGSVGITANGYNFYQYKDVVSRGTFVNFRNNGLFAPTAPTGRGWFDTIDKCNVMIMTIDISATPMSDADIAALTAKIDGAGYTHEWGYGVSIEAGENIEVAYMDISECTGESIYTGIIHSDDPSQYTLLGNIGTGVRIHHNNIHHNRRQGISLAGPNDVEIYNNEIHHIGYQANETIPTGDYKWFVAPGYGIDIESMVGESNVPYKDLRSGKDGLEVNYRIRIENNYIHDNIRGHLVNPDGTYVTVEGNIFQGNNIGGIFGWDNPFTKYVNNIFDGCIFAVNYDNVCEGAILVNYASLNIGSAHGVRISDVYAINSSMQASGTEGYFGPPSAVDVSTGTFTVPGHGMGAGAKVIFEQWQGKVPTGITPGKTYYTTNITADTFQVSNTSAGTALPITDSGAAGFIVARWNYGKCYIENVLFERDDFDTSTTPNNVNILGAAGMVIKNMTVRKVQFEISSPDNWQGRPAVIEGLTVIDTGGKINGVRVSNGKFISGVGNVGMELGNYHSQTQRLIMDNCIFQNINVDIGAVTMLDCNMANCNISKTNAQDAYSLFLKCFLDNVIINLHWIAAPEKVKFAQCIVNKVTKDVSTGTTFVSTLDLATGITS